MNIATRSTNPAIEPTAGIHYIPPETSTPLANVALALGIVLTVILIVNNLLDMPVKFRALWSLWRK